MFKDNTTENISSILLLVLLVWQWCISFNSHEFAFDTSLTTTVEIVVIVPPELVLPKLVVPEEEIVAPDGVVSPEDVAVPEEVVPAEEVVSLEREVTPTGVVPVCVWFDADVDELSITVVKEVLVDVYRYDWITKWITLVIASFI